MFKNLIVTCFLGMLAIILGAFGAHALKEILTSDQLLSFETAVRYQMYHVIVLLFVNTFDGFSIKQKNRISYIFFLGILFFSGSIYLIQLTAITAKSIWFITPLGGLFFIVGWLSMIVIFVNKIRE
ncbi:Uncharacterized membrane protein YgdD, TMEM256/DUF423 family [Polaribacter sp. KT25b]|uniref:DUF423 domain-containing protein n=1 Tax=Polaribacter sp. KT25b TaxID=1855336 RepID=UPI00087AEAB7|nr:DUF423 domain-containing protein [Polaribacter sp. KT25b]SDR70895.1 Uncharacterized membrane protein YgdD, TMEM256/DUF423 family [Polaribacter sp. KT25b]